MLQMIESVVVSQMQGNGLDKRQFLSNGTKFEKLDYKSAISLNSLSVS